MASDLIIKYDCRIHVFKYVDYDISATAPTGTDLIPSGWSDTPQQQLDANKVNVWSYSDYDFVNSRSLGNWSTPIVVTGVPFSGALDYGYNFGYSDSADTPPSDWGKILASPTGDYMWMEKYRLVNDEPIRTFDQILINNETELFTNYLRDVVIHKYDVTSESMATREITGCEIYMNTEIADIYFTGKEYVIFENEKYYLDPLNVQKSNDKNSGKYKYILAFTNEHSILQRTPFKNIASITSDPQFYTNQNDVYFVGNIAELKDRINANLLKSYSAYNYSVSYASGFTPTLTEYKEININNGTIFDALSVLYDTFGVLFHYDGYNILLGFEADNLTNVFEYGAAGGGLEIIKNVTKKHIITSVSGKGGSTNIPYRYPLIRDEDNIVIEHPYTATSLMPTCYTETVRKKVQTDAIDYDENILLVNSYEAIPNDTYLNESGTPVDVEYENYLNAANFSHEYIDFEDIYPTIHNVSYAGQRIDKIKSVSFLDTDTDFNGTEATAKSSNEAIAYFNIELHPMGFDLYASAIETGAMTLKMQSGDCSGCEFEVVGDFSRVYSQLDVFFAKQDRLTGTFQSTDFLKLYDLDWIMAIRSAVDIEEFEYLRNTKWVAQYYSKVRAKLNSLMIGTSTAKDYMKAKIDEVYPYNSLYRAVIQPYVMTSPNIWDMYAPFGDLKDQIYDLYDNWLTYTDEVFAEKAHYILWHINRWDRDAAKIRLAYFNDYPSNTTPPPVPYYAGDTYITKIRDLENYPDSTNASITLRVKKDEATYDTILPNKYLKPATNDVFTILNISLPDTYITAAQRLLDKSLKLYLQSKNTYNNSFVIKLSSIFLANNPTIANQLVVDSFMSFKYKNSTIKQQIKKVTRSYDSLPYNYTIEFYNQDDKPKTQTNRLVTLQQIVASTRRAVTNQTVTNRKLFSNITGKIAGIEEQATINGGLASGKTTTFTTQPRPPYNIGDMWNDNGVMKRSSTQRLISDTYNSADWIVTAKTTQFVKGIDKQTGNYFEHEQKEDIVTQKLELDNDSTLVLLNSEGFITENKFILSNVNGVKSITLEIDSSNLGVVICDTSLPISIGVDEYAIITISYTKELNAIITIKNGLIEDKK